MTSPGLNVGDRKCALQRRVPRESTPEVAISREGFRGLRYGGDPPRLLAAAQRILGDQVRGVGPLGLGWQRRRGARASPRGWVSGGLPCWAGLVERRGAAAVRAEWGPSPPASELRTGTLGDLSDSCLIALLPTLRSFIHSFNSRVLSPQAGTWDLASDDADVVKHTALQYSEGDRYVNINVIRSIIVTL